MLETGENSANGSQAGEAAVDRHPFRRVIVGAWADLFRSRDSLLLKIYGRLADLTPPGSPPPATLAEARARADAGSPGVGVSEMDRDLAETRMVRTTRILAAWLALWSTIVPLSLIGVFIAWRLRRIPAGEGDWIDLTVVAICCVVLFPFLAILGLLLQAPLMRPLVALLTRSPKQSTAADPGGSRNLE